LKKPQRAYIQLQAHPQLVAAADEAEQQYSLRAAVAAAAVAGALAQEAATESPPLQVGLHVPSGSVKHFDDLPSQGLGYKCQAWRPGRAVHNAYRGLCCAARASTF
jgi:hypothetical protein